MLTARTLNAALRIVARSSYQDSTEKLRRAGANQVVSPYLMGAHRMAALAVRPVAVDVLDTVLHGENIDLVVEELLVLSSSKVLGKTLADSGIREAGPPPPPPSPPTTPLPPPPPPTPPPHHPTPPLSP